MPRRKKRHEEEHENHERWAIPYGDLLTLLLAFFVVMYSISSVNSGKYRVLSDSIYAAFRGNPRSLDPIQLGRKQLSSPTDVQTVLKNQPQSSLSPIGSAAAASMPVALQPKAASGPDAEHAARAKAAAIVLNKVADEVARAMAPLVQKNLVMVRRKQGWIEVEIRTDILFPSGSARLASSAVDVIQRLADVLAPFPNPIRVEGFTDDVPIRTALFYSNWELSAARAGSVVHVLSERGVASDRLAVVGFGDQHPVASNTNTQGRNANRRVTVIILSTEPAASDPTWLPNSGQTASSGTLPAH